MQYDDSIYGTVEIDEPILLQLMDSNAMQRLKSISQHGITAVIGITPPFSRYDHSVGAMLLVRRLGASLDEQIAALLHDVSHTAFSHVIDFVFDDQKGQSYHEDKKEEIVAASDIPKILSIYGKDWVDFMDETKFGLLEQEPPALCADRVDYFLRDLEFLGLASSDEIHVAVDSLEVKDGKIVVKHPDVARWMAYTYIETDRTSWSSFREVGLYQITAEALKIAIHQRFLDESDIWSSDEALWQKLRAIKHPKIKQYVNLVTPGTRFTWDDENPLFRVSTKIRSIDPPVSIGDNVIQLSNIDATFRRYRQDYISGKQGLWPMGIVSPSASPVDQVI